MWINGISITFWKTWRLVSSYFLSDLQTFGTYSVVNIFENFMTCFFLFQIGAISKMAAAMTEQSNPPTPNGESDKDTTPSIVIKEEPKDESEMELTIQMAMSSALQAHPMTGHNGRMRYRYTNTRSSELPDTPVCEVCQSELPNQALLTLHKLCHFNTRHVCYVCDGYFTQSDTLALHMATTHRKLNTFAGDRDALVCPVCLQRFSNKMSFKHHQTQHTLKDNSSSVCRICGLSFSSPRGLVAHLNSPRHREMKVKMQSVFVCVDCRAIFATRDSYAMHMMMRAQSESCTPLQFNEMDPAMMGQGVKDEMSPGLIMVDQLAANASSSPAGNVPVNLTKSGNIGVDLTGDTNQCNKCRASFASQDALALHVMMHSQAEGYPAGLSTHHLRSSHLHQTQPSPWCCTRCAINFDSCDTLAMHMMTRHANEVGSYGTDLAPGLQHILQVRQAQLLGQLRQAQSFEESQQSRSLDLSSPASVKSDLTMMRKPTEIPSKRPSSVGTNVPPPSKMSRLQDNNGRMWECWECKEAFPSQTLWLEHIFNCSKLKLVSPQCEICNAEFADFQSLREHMETSGHLDGTRDQHICSGCGWTTSSLDSLQEHKTTCLMCKMPDGFQDREIDMSTKSSSSLEPGERVPSRENGHYGKPNGEPTLKRPHSTPTDLLHKDTDIGFKFGQSFGQFPESSTNQEDQNQSGSERSQSTPAAGIISQSGIAESEEGGEGEIIDFVLSRSSDLSMCKHCSIVYLDRTMYYLHMGLHNLNNPWQCNMCGKACRDKHEFTSHVIHYQWRHMFHMTSPNDTDLSDAM